MKNILIVNKPYTLFKNNINNIDEIHILSDNVVIDKLNDTNISYIIFNDDTKLSCKSFCNCQKLTFDLLPTKIESIPDYCFKDCRSLTFCEIPKNIKRIHTGAFQNSGIKNLILNEGLEYISLFAFAEIDISHVIIPKSVKNINEFAFSDCKNLSIIYYYSDIIYDSLKYKMKNVKFKKLV